MTLMTFEDASEGVKIRGPLFAAATKLNVAVFGPAKFHSPRSQTLLNAAIKKSLRSSENPIVDLASSIDLELSQSHFLSNASISTSQLSTSTQVYTNREVHDQLHYSTLGLTRSKKHRSGLLDHIMLRRALDGYLFDCKINKRIATDDQWLQDTWEWIQGESSQVLETYMLKVHAGAHEAAQDDTMVCRPLDLSYMGVYTIWMNVLGGTSDRFCLSLLTFR
jgi:WD repeat-containing protein mio